MCARPLQRWLIGVMLTVVLGPAGPAGAAALDVFARCLTSRGATFYGTAWCPHCRSQNDLFGSSSRYLRYVECSDPQRADRRSPDCTRRGIASFPTWTFRDGSQLRGRQPLEHLAGKTGCRLPR